MIGLYIDIDIDIDMTTSLHGEGLLHLILITHTEHSVILALIDNIVSPVSASCGPLMRMSILQNARKMPQSFDLTPKRFT
jgi:hypothetical protein